MTFTRKKPLRPWSDQSQAERVWWTIAFAHEHRRAATTWARRALVNGSDGELVYNMKHAGWQWLGLDPLAAEATTAWYRRKPS